MVFDEGISLRVSFLTGANTDEITSPGFLMPPYWAAILVCNLPDEVKKGLVVRPPQEICDFYFSSFKTCNERVLSDLKNIKEVRKSQNPRSLVVVGGWGPTLYPEAFSQNADIVVLGTFNQAIGTFSELLSGWDDGQIAGLNKIKGVYTQDAGYTGFRLPTLGNPMDWEEFCKLTRMRLSDYEAKQIGLLFIPLRVSPFSCPNYVNPLVENVRKATKEKVGCNFCRVAYAADKLATKLRDLGRGDIVDNLILGENNFDKFLSRAKKEVTSALNQLEKEGFQGKTELYDCDDTISTLKLELLLKLMELEYRNKRIKDYLTMCIRVRPDILGFAIGRLEEEGLIGKCAFEIEINYASANDIKFSNANFGEKDLKKVISSLKRCKENYFMGLFILTSPKSGPKDFAENVDMVVKSIGAGIRLIDLGDRTWIGNNRLSEEYSVPYKVNPKIRRKVEQYLHCLNSWLGEKSLSQAISENETFRETLEKVFSALGRSDQSKRDQVLSLRNALERLLKII